MSTHPEVTDRILPKADHWLNELNKLSLRRARFGNVPIVSLVLQNDILVGETPADAQRLDFSDHGEMAALRSTNLDSNLTLITSVEPCLMCLGACCIKGVEKIIFGLEAAGDGADPRLYQNFQNSSNGFPAIYRFKSWEGLLEPCKTFLETPSLTRHQQYIKELIKKNTESK